MRRIALAAAMCLAGTTLLGAQTMDVPVPVQVALFLKVLNYDRNRSMAPADTLIVGIAYQSGNRASASAHDAVVSALGAAAGQPVRALSIDLDKQSLADGLRRGFVRMLYVAPLRAVDVGDLAATTRAARVTSVTGAPGYVSQGVSVGVRLQGDRPKLLVNLRAARAEGADFSSELLKLAQVVP